MTDRELLELAAKAAGIDLEWDGPPDMWQPMYYKGKTYHAFDPLTDDGDALRLAVKLNMVIDTDWNEGANAGNAYVDFSEPEYGYQEGKGKVDRYAATRRAIVRAAAEIGREK